MATDDIAKLKARRDQIYIAIRDLQTNNLDKPDASGGPAPAIQFRAHIKSLYDELDMIDKRLAKVDIAVVESEEY
jgi:cell division protein FtsB